MILAASKEDPSYPVPSRLLGPNAYVKDDNPKNYPRPTPHVTSTDEYLSMWEESISNPDAFWGRMGKDLLSWSKPPTQTLAGSLSEGNVRWFADGELNACYNCVDRHALEDPSRIALIYEPDEPNSTQYISYGELLAEVSRLSNVLTLDYGLRPGDTVAIYLPMIPAAVIAMLACARIGCPHTVIFAGFSAGSVADRIHDAQSRVLITSNEGRRGGKVIPLKSIADKALESCPSVKHVLVYERSPIPDPLPEGYMTEGRDEFWSKALPRHRPYFPPVPMSAESPLFLLYTSGSTGLPKGVLHTTGGYLLGAATTVKYVFDVHPGDRFGCTADVGWITGHTYIVYGPLSLGVSTVLLESVPTYPTPARYWQLVDEAKLTHFYTAPTAIRSLIRLGDHWPFNSDLTSLRVLGSVGEPINPEAWEWYNDKVGREQCAIVDTYWQTETGSIVISPLPGVTNTKPGSATLPLWGIDVAVLDPQTGVELQGRDVTGVLALRQPWPSMARSVWKDHPRYMSTYLNPYPGYYFTGDGVSRDRDGYYWIRGRVDDVINVSGHRLSTSEIESALSHHEFVAESAAVGTPDPVTGQCVFAFVTLKDDDITGAPPQVEVKDLALKVRTEIGPFATPKCIIIVEELPKTRSGKIVRRVLRKIVDGEADSLGDLSTVANPEIVPDLIKIVNISDPRKK
ncbi:MAG: acetyl-coenzyme A synthetase [Piptocephalis tieghemiana]|nr:MAG: acetyl-coenzyme A synthetase [Piptocephalis tieghemiana]